MMDNKQSGLEPAAWICPECERPCYPYQVHADGGAGCYNCDFEGDFSDFKPLYAGEDVRDLLDERIEELEELCDEEEVSSEAPSPPPAHRVDELEQLRRRLEADASADSYYDGDYICPVCGQTWPEWEEGSPCCGTPMLKEEIMQDYDLDYSESSDDSSGE